MTYLDLIIDFTEKINNKKKLNKVCFNFKTARVTELDLSRFFFQFRILKITISKSKPTFSPRRHYFLNNHIERIKIKLFFWNFKNSQSV
jgi:hypothetical protein